MNQPHGAKKDFIWSVATAAVTALAVRLAEMAFDAARDKVEQLREESRPKQSKSGQSKKPKKR
jgi:hypothetical protein